MPIIIAKGVVEVTADGTKIPGQVARDIDSNGKPVEESGRGLGGKLFKGILAVGATVGVGTWFAGAISGASDFNETASKTSAIFGDQTRAISQWADNAATNVGLSTSAAMGAAASFGDMFLQLGFTGTAAADMSKNVVQAAADLGSFSNLETADVADRISAAFRGEYDSLQAVIPNINAARVESEAMAATGKKTTAELTAQEKATAVLAIVQKDGARAMGDFARTSDGAANKGKILTATLEDQQNRVGSQLMPAWQGILGYLGDVAIPMFSDLITWVGKNSETVLLLGGVVAGTALAFGIATAVGTAYRSFQVASAASTTGLTVAQWALNTAMSSNPIGLLIIAIGALVAGLVWVATQTTFFQDTWANVTSFIGTAWTWLWDTVLNPVFTAIGSAFSWLYNTIILPIVTGIMIYVGLWAALFTWLYSAAIAPVLNGIGSLFSWLYTNAVLPTVARIQTALTGLGIVFNWLNTNIVQPVFAALGVAFNWVWVNAISPVIGAISGAISTIGATVRNVFGGISSFIGSAFQAVLGVVRGPLNGLIGLINGVISGLNSIKVTIPAWVPIVGGNTFGLSLPRLPMLAKGTNNAPGAFIAGEAGPELITGASGATVRPYGVTSDLLARGGGAPSEEWRGVMALLAKLLDAVREIPGAQVNLEQNFPDTDEGILRARQTARELTRYLGVA